MRETLLAIALLAIVSCKKDCHQSSCKTNLTKGLLAYYPFNGNFNDESKNENDAVPVNGAKLGSDMIGRQSSAAEFDGIDDYLIVKNSTDFNTNVITVSCLVMVKSIGRSHGLINRVDFETAQGFQWGIGQALESDQKFSFAVAPSSEDCSFVHVYEPNNSVFADVIIQPERWYNVIATFEKGNQNIYIDGKLVGSEKRSFKTLKNCTATDLVLGGWWSGGITSLDGKLDEVRIYNRSLSNCEISELSSIFSDIKTDK